ncbi:unnamed protein product [Adineta ricciae]|uniref:G-protein coupled receptors family 1 profile domain-containing protein n=1 Tax=Adineta ricciae TaxID=249248 RepID=A0A815LL95_ADIRI|nr:unnamed protein product [Adineta ricciae]
MSSTSDSVSSISYVTMQINRHVALVVLLFGTVGNIVNMIVLSEQTFNKIPCTNYLYWSSMSAVIYLWSALPTRILEGYSITWQVENGPMCKFRVYSISIAWAVAIWALVGASIDRFLCSSRLVARRQLSTLQMERRYIIVVFTFFTLLFIEVLYCFEAHVPNVPVACYGRNMICRIAIDWIYLLLIIILPSILLIAFGILTMRNIRTRVIRPTIGPMQNTVSNNTTNLPRNDERTLTKMLLVQKHFRYSLFS